MDLSIIIVSYNTHELTKSCIERIYDPLEYKIVVIDNGETTEVQLKEIHDLLPEVEWVVSGTNLGFGRAVNLGLKLTKTPYVLLLNSDVLTDKKTILKGVEKLNLDKDIGILGGLILNEDGSVQNSKYSFIGDHQEILESNLLLDKLINFKSVKFRALMGSFLYIRRQAFNLIGGFDPDFFMYCEELDFCARLEKSKFKLNYTEELSVVHYGEGSAVSAMRTLKQRLASRSLLVLKRKGRISVLFAQVLIIFNLFCNGVLMWLLDADYRKGYWRHCKAHFLSIPVQIGVIFNYKRKLGNGKRRPLRIG